MTELKQTLSFIQSIPASRVEVFSFFCDEKNLEVLTPPWLCFKVLKKSTAELQTGTLIDYSLRLRGFPVRWQSRIENWEENSRFVDTQLRGPYRYWHHTHEFLDESHGTLMKDTIIFEVPGGKWGRTILGPWVKGDVTKIFEYRRQKIKEIFG